MQGATFLKRIPARNRRDAPYAGSTAPRESRYVTATTSRPARSGMATASESRWPPPRSLTLDTCSVDVLGTVNYLRMWNSVFPVVASGINGFE
jgi:hypothetical protein